MVGLGGMMKEVLGGLVGGGLKKREWIVVAIGLDDAVGGVRGDSREEGLNDIFLCVCSSA